jgi:hypothetical protein
MQENGKISVIYSEPSRVHIRWSGGIATHILNLGTSGTWVVSLTQLYPQGTAPIPTGWVGPQARSEEWRLYPCLGLNPDFSVSQSIAYHYIESHFIYLPVHLFIIGLFNNTFNTSYIAAMDHSY